MSENRRMLSRFQANDRLVCDIRAAKRGRSMAPLRLFLADDHEIVRYGLRSLLESQAGWTVVGEAADGKAAIEGVLECDPDVTLLDISMPSLTGCRLHGRFSPADRERKFSCCRCTMPRKCSAKSWIPAPAGLC